ncbi:WD domain protein [Thelotrema lepadinum]|nr:WD domain protein [Thelotrema lepadinum]
MTRSRLPYNASPPTDSRSPSNAPSPKRRRITSSTTKKQHPTRYSSPDELAGRDSSEDQATRYNRRRSSGKVKDTADYPSAVHRRSGRKSKSNSYDDGAELTPTRPPRNEDEGSPDELDHTVHTFYRGRRGRAGSGSGTASGQISGAQSRDGNEDLGTGTGAIHGRGGRRERFRSDDEEMHDQDRKPARLRNESRSQTRNRSRSTRRNRSPSRSRSRNSTRRRRRRSSTHSSILDRPRHYTPDDASRRTASPPPHSPLDTETPAADQDINMTPAGLEEEELDDEALLAEAEADLEAKADREAKEAAEPPKPVEIPYIPYRESMVLRGHKRGVAAVKFSPDGKWIASCSADATIRVWDAGRGKCVHVLEAHMAGISTIAWSPDSETLASGSDDKSIRLWNAVTVRFTTSLFLDFVMVWEGLLD